MATGSAIVERKCPLLLTPLDSENTPRIEDISKQLEKGTEEEKIEAIKKIIHCIISGIDMTRLTMQVIKFCLSSKNHKMKKLLLIFWEVLDKKDANTGKLKTEMILVCNYLLQDLKHSNEYIRGSTLRLLCRIEEPEILEQLVPQMLANLEHRHSYVRKNAVLAIMSVLTHHPQLIPDASSRIYQFLQNESSNSAKRNAFLMLTNSDLRNALDFFLSIQEKITSMPETMQITILELMRKVCRSLPVPKSIFVKCAASLLDSPSNAVVYEAANTLLSLTPLDSAVNRALEAYTRLLQMESDQNVKLIVINRLNALRVRYERNLKFIIMDILRGLSTPNIDVRRNILTLVLDLASGNNIEDIISSLKKEIIQIDNISDQIADGGIDVDANVIEYRNMLVNTIHHCAVKFPVVASSVVHLLMNYLGDDSGVTSSLNASGTANVVSSSSSNADGIGMGGVSGMGDSRGVSPLGQISSNISSDVISFVREIVQEYPDLRSTILDKLLESFNDIRSEQVYRVSLWIFGEYSESTSIINRVCDQIVDSIGELPLIDEAEAYASLMNSDDGDHKNDDSNAMSNKPGYHYFTRTVVLKDGTYAQTTVAMNNRVEQELDLNSNQNSAGKTHCLRNLLTNGEYFLASVLASTLLKLIMKYNSFDGKDSHKLTAKCMLIITSIIRFGTAASTKNRMDNDTKDRMLYVLHKLMKMHNKNDDDDDEKTESIENGILMGKCRKNFGMMLSAKREFEEKKREEFVNLSNDLGHTPFDSMLNIRQLRGLQFSEFDEDDSLNIRKAIGNRVLDENLRTRLSRVHQLTGFSDPIYCEAAVTVHQFDIVLDFLLMNNTEKTLQNLTLELHTSGDLKLVEKPTKITLGPGQSERIEASIKVSSTENGVIFGNICYDSTGATIDDNIVVMNCIHMDIMDYVHPCHCSEKKFREFWVEFEWENKVPVNTDIVDLKDYIHHISSITNMQLLTPIDDNKNCQFLAANLHAMSIFGEHALMNISIEDTTTAASSANATVALSQESGNDNDNNKKSKSNANKDRKIGGHIRIRCKSQGIALSLGEKITNKQRSS